MGLVYLSRRMKMMASKISMHDILLEKIYIIFFYYWKKKSNSKCAFQLL